MPAPTLTLQDLQAYGSTPAQSAPPQSAPKTLTLQDLQTYGGSAAKPDTSNSTGDTLLDGMLGASSDTLLQASTIYRAIRKIPGADKILPDPTAFEDAIKQATPDNTPAHVGRFLMNAAEFAIPAGEVEEALAGAGKLRAAARTVAQAGVGAGVSAVQSGGDPVATTAGAVLGGAAELAQTGLRAATTSLPRLLYRSALSPTRTMLEDNPGMIDAGLEGHLPVSQSSLAKIAAGIEAVRNDINAGVASRAGGPGGATVDPNVVVNALDELRGMYENSANPNFGGGVKAIDKVKQQFLEAHGMQPASTAATPASTILGPNGQPIAPATVVTTPAVPAQPMGIDEAQLAKVNTHAILRGAYSDMKGAEVEATKQLARGLKEQIESVFPEIADLNQKQSDLMGLDDAMQRAVWNMGSKDLLPLQTAGAGVAGHVIAGGPGAAIGVVAKALDKLPELKSKLAILLATKGVRNTAQFIDERLANVATAAAQTGTTEALSEAGKD